MFRLNNNIPFSPQRWPFFYGYWIVVCSAIGMMMSVPGQTMGVSAFTNPLLDALSIDRLTLSSAYAAGTIVSSLMIPVAGQFIDRVGPRITAILSSLGLGAVLFYLSRVDHISTAAAEHSWLRHGSAAFLLTSFGFFLVRFFGQGTLTLASRTMLIKWFVRQRGRMNSRMGVAVAATFGSAPALFAALIHRQGWRGAWVLMAIVAVFVFPVFAFVFFRDTPEACGLRPDGAPAPTATEEAGERPSVNLPGALKTYTFWVYNIGVSMFSMLMTAYTFHYEDIFASAGFPDKMLASSIFVPATIASVIINLVGGSLYDRPAVRKHIRVFLLLLFVGLAVLCTGIICLPWGLTGRIILIAGYALANGLFGILIAISWPHFFGRHHVGAISGFNMTFLVLFSAVGPVFFAAGKRLQGTYNGVAVIAIAVIGLLMILSFFSRRPDHEERG